MISLLNITKLVMDMSMTEMRYKYIWFLIEIIIIRMNGSFALETQKVMISGLIKVKWSWCCLFYRILSNTYNFIINKYF